MIAAYADTDPAEESAMAADEDVPNVGPSLADGDIRGRIVKAEIHTQAGRTETAIQERTGQTGERRSYGLR